MTRKKPKHVSHKCPCPICGRPDWCLLGEQVVFCMRVPSAKQTKGGAYIHPIKTDRRTYEKARPIASKTYRDWSAFMQAVRTSNNSYRNFASIQLGLQPNALQPIGASWFAKENAVAFPMYNERYTMVGIRLRGLDGRKWAVKGSTNGLFMDAYRMIRYDQIDRLVVCEGPTDTATAIIMGYVAIGKACVSTNHDMIEKIVVDKKVQSVTVVVDNDKNGVGIEWSTKLAMQLKAQCSVALFQPPCKDLRDYYTNHNGYKIEGVAV